MINHKKVAILLFVGLISISSLIILSYAATFTMTIPAGEEADRKIDLEVDDRVIIKFTVIGKENNLISFSLVCPNATEKSFGNTGYLSYSFVCDTKGEYKMNFANNDTIESKLVTLNYEIEHYILGMPQMLFFALVITGVCIVMLTVYVLTSPS